MGATARGVLLLVQDAVARAHGAALFAAAFADANAAQGGAGETLAVEREFEMRFRFPRMILGAEPEIDVAAPRFHDFAGVHFPFGIPDFFEFNERAADFRP